MGIIGNVWRTVLRMRMLISGFKWLKGLRHAYLLGQNCAEIKTSSFFLSSRKKWPAISGGKKHIFTVSEN